MTKPTISYLPHFQRQPERKPVGSTSPYPLRIFSTSSNQLSGQFPGETDTFCGFFNLKARSYLASSGTADNHTFFALI